MTDSNRKERSSLQTQTLSTAPHVDLSVTARKEPCWETLTGEDWWTDLVMTYCCFFVWKIWKKKTIPDFCFNFPPCSLLHYHWSICCCCTCSLESRWGVALLFSPSAIIFSSCAVSLISDPSSLSAVFQMPLKATTLLLALMCVCCVEECVCFPNGSVAFSCGNMMPVHPPFSPSTSSPPFTLSASSATYRPGGVISGASVRQRSHNITVMNELLQGGNACYNKHWQITGDMSRINTLLWHVWCETRKGIFTLTWSVIHNGHINRTHTSNMQEQ